MLMKKRKLTIFIMLAIVSACLAGCGTKKPAENDAVNETADI